MLRKEIFMDVSNTGLAQKKDVSVVLGGQAGQGIQTVEKILVHCLKKSGFHVYATKEYMSRVRGGVNSTQIRISSDRVSSYIDRIDILLPFHQLALFHLAKRISPETTVIGDKQNICTECPDNIGDFKDIPLAEIADAIGGKIYINIIAIGVVLGMFGADLDGVISYIGEFFSRKSDDIMQKNQEAIRKGYEHGQFLFGLSLANLGGNPKFRQRSENLPSLLRVGVGARLFDEQLLTSLEIENQFHGSMKLKNGYEAKLQNKYFIRAGYALYPGQDGSHLNQDLSFGVGALLGPASFDYAFSPQDNISSETLHRFSISLLL